MKALFVNACLRGADSRTLRLCEAFWQAAEAHGVQPECVELAALQLAPYSAEDAAERERRIEAEDWAAPCFRLARQLAEADFVLVGAPYWDLMFPAALKVYLEHVCARNVTFRYREDGALLGLCRAPRAVYLTTAGGPIGTNDFGTAYLRAVLGMLGIPKLDAVRAEGLDIAGNDAEAILQPAMAQARRLADEAFGARASK